MHWILKKSRRKPNQTTQVEDGNEDFGKCMENARENELGTDMCYGWGNPWNCGDSLKPFGAYPRIDKLRKGQKMLCNLERFSSKCCTHKTKVIIVVNHKWHGQSREPIKNLKQKQSMPTTRCAGKRVRSELRLVQVLLLKFLLDDEVARVF